MRVDEGGEGEPLVVAVPVSPLRNSSARDVYVPEGLVVSIDAIQARGCVRVTVPRVRRERNPDYTAGARTASLMSEVLSPLGVMEILKRSDRPLAQNLNLRNHPDLSLRDEANAITSFAFRNGFLEDLHAGTPSPLVHLPARSRITDDEMKKLMVESSALVARWLYLREILLERAPFQYSALLRGYLHMYCAKWERKKVQVNLRRPRETIPCFVCGEPLVGEWSFCPYCGHRVG